MNAFGRENCQGKHSNEPFSALVVFRCVKGEGEIEKLQAKVVELRRKLEDTTAAMQELGRENQSLQVSRETPSELQEQNHKKNTTENWQKC